MKEIQNKIFINGRFLNAESNKVIDVYSPRDGKIITQIPLCENEDLVKAIFYARQTFNNGIWKNLLPEEKKKILLNLAELIEKNSKELSYLETLDTGKPIQYSQNIDLPITINCIRWYAELVDKINDKLLKNSEHEKIFIEMVPTGVVAALIPWNFPLYICALKIAPILIAGNSVIIKPSEKASLSILKLGELMKQAGMPNGVFNIITGDGKLGELMGLSNEINCISFTGSTKVGKKLLQYSSQSNMKRVFLECGGKSPCIITKDYKDLDTVASQIAFNVFFNQGATCGSNNRVIVDSSVKNELTELLIKESQKFIPDDPLLKQTKMGAIIDSNQSNSILIDIKKSIQEGANILLGGTKINPVEGGEYIHPTIISDIKSHAEIIKKEIFGPVITIEEINSTDQIIEEVNSSTYGLTASVFCNNLQIAMEISNRLNVGTVSINKITDGNIRTPFGGFRQSGIGRDRSHEAINNYCEIKTTWINIK